MRRAGSLASVASAMMGTQAAIVASSTRPRVGRVMISTFPLVPPVAKGGISTTLEGGDQRADLIPLDDRRQSTARDQAVRLGKAEGDEGLGVIGDVEHQDDLRLLVGEPRAGLERHTLRPGKRSVRSHRL